MKPRPVSDVISGLRRDHPSWIYVSIEAQRLVLYGENNEVLIDVPVSTAANGPGERDGSNCTPRGLHLVRARIGGDCPMDTVFIGRLPSGERYTPELRARHPERHWILGRILWLSGMEPGRNRGGDVDTMRRYIYIHGSPDDEPMGVPGSHGCIKLRNRDVLALFDRSWVCCPVYIDEGRTGLPRKSAR